MDEREEQDGTSESLHSFAEETTAASDESQDSSEQVTEFDFGEFEVKSVHPDGHLHPEIRLSHEESQSNLVLRQPVTGLKRGDTIRLIATKK